MEHSFQPKQMCLGPYDRALCGNGLLKLEDSRQVEVGNGGGGRTGTGRRRYL